MSKGLFLHYGPGGNAAIEREYFKEIKSKIDFWDQPLSKNNSNVLDALVESVVIKINSENYEYFIGHSFGCDLLTLAFSKMKKALPAKTVLISPLMSIQKSVINLSTQLNQLNKSEEINFILDKLTKDSFEQIETEHFWKLCHLNSTHTHYHEIFWHSKIHFSRIINIHKSARAFDAKFWQQTMYEYLIANKNSLVINKKFQGSIVLGKNDPYYNTEDFNLWEISLVQDQLFVIDKSGHFPHIEQKSVFLNILEKTIGKT